LSASTKQALLPEEFVVLEDLAASWIFETEEERYTKRLVSSMDELQAFYDLALPLGAQARKHLDQFDIDDLPEKELNLIRLMFALITITFPVEAFRQPKVPDTGTTYMTKSIEPGP
jgi:hypothetical protein